MKIKLNNNERTEILKYLRNGVVPAILESRSSLNTFKKRAGKFIFITNIVNGVEEYALKFKVGVGHSLRFFTSNEQQFKLDYIILEHVSNGHAGRDRLYPLLETRVYGATKVEVQNVLTLKSTSSF